MTAPASPPRTGLNRLLLGALALVSVLLGFDALRTANVRADLQIAVEEAGRLRDGLLRYYGTHGEYPDGWEDPRFDRTTLDPVRRRGYYTGFLTTVLRGSRVDAYLSPDDSGSNQEFWLEMTLERDPSIRLVVARSDDAPLGGGEWLDGVYVYRNGTLTRM